MHRLLRMVNIERLPNMKIGCPILAIFSLFIPFTFGFTTDIRSATPNAPATIIHYVKPVPTGTEDCSTWANACGLQTALGKAVSGDEIWVMTGIYIPITGSDRTATFQLKNGVALYGGFPDEVNPTWEDREWTAYPSTLSGDIDGDGDLTNNAYRVVSAKGITGTATLDGFIISGANNDNLSAPDQFGGGLYAEDSLLVIRNMHFEGNSAGNGGGMFINGDEEVVLEEVEFSKNTATINGGGLQTYAGNNAILTDVTFDGNSADENGGGMIIYGSGSPTLSNVIFSGNSAKNEGGGIYNFGSNTPTLAEVTFSGNSAGDGGGMSNQYSSPTLTNVTFDGNSADNYYGGGMYNWESEPTLTEVTFSGNTAKHTGGGMSNFISSPTLTDVTFDGNIAVNYHGGGMYNNDSSPTLMEVTFSGNSAGNGGGMYNYYGIPTLRDVTFSGNSAGNGGGMYNFYSDSTLAEVTFSGNSAGNGGGMYNYNSSPALTDATLSGNSAAERGGGMSNRGWIPSLENTILWGNTAGTSDAQIENFYGSTPSISYSDVQGGCATIPGNDCTGGGNIDADPLFVRNPSPGGDGTWGTSDDDYGNLRLRINSPAIDAGNNAAVPPGVNTDLDGNPRFVDIPGVPDSGNGTPPIVDMGAYEAQYLIINLPLVIK